MQTYHNQLGHHRQQGFTLIELMISVTLGLIIIAVASQIYLTSYSTSAVQSSAGEIQASSIFGIQQVESHVRLANLGNEISSINGTTPNGGIALKASNVAGITDDSNVNLTKAGSLTDRLTIQFDNITGKKMFSCEGAEFPSATNSATTIIESYYLDTTNHALKCDASVGGIAGLGSGAVTIIEGVDAFSVLLGVQDSSGKIAYVTKADYGSSTDSIVSIKMGFLLRGDKPITGETQQQFSVLGQTVTVGTTSGVSGNYIRNSYESTTSLRNARVIF